MKTATDHAREIFTGFFTNFSSRKGIRHALDAWDPDDIDSLRGEIIARVEAVREEMRDALYEDLIKRAGNMRTLPSVYRGGFEDAAEIVRDFGKAKP